VDPLISLNSLSLIEKMSDSPQGLDYLSQSGTIDKLENLLTKEKTLHPFFLSEMIRALGLLSTKKPEQEWWDRYHFIDIFEHFLECEEVEFQEATLSAMAQVGENEDGLKQIVYHPHLLKNFVKFVSSSTSILSTSCLHSLATIFRSCPEDESLLQQLFSELPQESGSSSPLSSLLNCAEKSCGCEEEETRAAVFDLLQSFCFHSCTAEPLLSYPGFFDWLIRRPASLNQKEAEWKYEIISTIVENLPKSISQKILGQNQFRELKRYFNQGAFYVPAPYQSPALIRTVVR